MVELLGLSYINIGGDVSNVVDIPSSFSLSLMDGIGESFPATPIDFPDISPPSSPSAVDLLEGASNLPTTDIEKIRLILVVAFKDLPVDLVSSLTPAILEELAQVVLASHPELKEILSYGPRSKGYLCVLKAVYDALEGIF